MQQLNPHFWDRIAAGYAARPVGDVASYEYKVEQMSQRLQPGMTVLEIGCGTGSTAITLAQKHPGVEFIAEDFSQEMINIAKEKAADLGLENLTFNCSCAEEGLLGDTQFDMIIAMNLILLVPDWRALVNQVASKLKPNGWWVTGHFWLGEVNLFIKLIAKPLIKIGQLMGRLPEQLHFLKRKAYCEAMQAAGLSIEMDWHPEGKPKIFFIMAQKLV